MCGSQLKLNSFTIAAVVLITTLMGMPQLSLAQSELTVTNDQSRRVSVVYIPPSNSTFQTLYDLLKGRRALEKIQEILSPIRWPEELTIKTAECGVVNSWYERENLKPTITVCYDFFEPHIGIIAK